MTAEERVKAIAEFGFTERQARFLVTVMLHAGVCVPRQYAAFARTAYGHNVTKFFDKLVQRGYATAGGCLHNRGRVGAGSGTHRIAYLAPLVQSSLTPGEPRPFLITWG